MSPCRPSLNPPRDVFPHPLLANQLNLCASCANSLSSKICVLFNSLAALFRARFLCFQQFAHSFTKTPGVGAGIPIRFGLSAGADAPGAAQPEEASSVYANTFKINTYRNPRGRGGSARNLCFQTGLPTLFTRRFSRRPESPVTLPSSEFRGKQPVGWSAHHGPSTSKENRVNPRRKLVGLAGIASGYCTGCRYAQSFCFRYSGARTCPRGRRKYG